MQAPFTLKSLLGGLVLAAASVTCAQQTVPIFGLVELSGTGATSGSNFDNGVKLAVKEINAAGGILGRRISYLSLDTQSNPGVAKALAQKAVDQSAYVVMGPVFSGSIMVSMAETRRAEIPNFTGGEAAAITQQGNPYVFRTSFTQSTAMPKIASYIQTTVKAKSVDVIYVNNDFGKGGLDAIRKELEARGVKVVNAISTEPGQIDFSAPVLRTKQSGSDAVFIYSNEEESARALRELRKQGYDKPMIGETVLTSQKVIELAGDAANGAVAHVGLTADAPQPLIRKFGDAFQAEYKVKSDHNGLKGYSGMYIVKAVTEKLGKFDSKAFAAAMKGVSLSVKDHPGILLDVSYDANGDLDRESYMTKVENGKQVISSVLPPVGRK
ncbi:ABC transporter substrate-binding protein [Polaromonas eurypsychrophila]|uniref:ABC transporter substrate-binding protein n=1 Tax=Polaromonas eurypsychrophila TaxID=1614635 RepID=A0A916SNI2_9BURK|nr:ABC transporter substrate-binding protein [Polaromonas eurypsychrophila]GGB06135.1 ABC transporter substrate-binding protein [Polaromonas eurypsychrophila]